MYQAIIIKRWHAKQPDYVVWCTGKFDELRQAFREAILIFKGEKRDDWFMRLLAYIPEQLLPYIKTFTNKCIELKEPL